MQYTREKLARLTAEKTREGKRSASDRVAQRRRHWETGKTLNRRKETVKIVRIDRQGQDRVEIYAFVIIHIYVRVYCIHSNRYYSFALFIIHGRYEKNVNVLPRVRPIIFVYVRIDDFLGTTNRSCKRRSSMGARTLHTKSGLSTNNRSHTRARARGTLVYALAQVSRQSMNPSPFLFLLLLLLLLLLCNGSV